MLQLAYVLTVSGLHLKLNKCCRCQSQMRLPAGQVEQGTCSGKLWSRDATYTSCGTCVAAWVVPNDPAPALHGTAQVCTLSAARVQEPSALLYIAGVAAPLAKWSRAPAAASCGAEMPPTHVSGHWWQQEHICVTAYTCLCPLSLRVHR